LFGGEFTETVDTGLDGVVVVAVSVSFGGKLL
jgi:hypothetical protein